MTRKNRPPLDFSNPTDETREDALEMTVTSMFEDDDLDIAQAPSPEPIRQDEAPVATPLVAHEKSQPATRERRSVAATASRPPAPVKGGAWPYGAALIATIAWLAVPVALYILGEAGPFGEINPVILLLLGLGPVLPFWTLGYVMSQGARLAAEARYARAQADDLIHPVALAAGATSDAVELIRDQIDQAVTVAGQARHELVTLREVLAAETAQLAQVAAQSAEAAARLTQTVGDERRELSALTEVLKAQAEEVEQSIHRQSAMVSQAADLADVKMREAEARLTNSASDLSTASGEAANAARTAGEDLSRQVARLEAAGTVVVEQVRTVEDSLAEQRAALVTVAHELRAEQEGFGAEVESRQAQLSAILANVRGSATEIAENAERGGEHLQILVENAAERFRALGEAAASERDHFSAEVLKSVGAISEAARSERELFVDEAADGLYRLADAATQAAEAAKGERERMLAEAQSALVDLNQAAVGAHEVARVEHARLLQEAQGTVAALHEAAREAAAEAAQQTDNARSRVDQLSEAAFAAGQQAEMAFQSRLEEARTLIERSATLVEDAGSTASAKLADSLKSAEETVNRLEKLVADVDARAARMPKEAEERQAEIRGVVEKGVEDLLGAARRAADETQAIDAAFQERVRRNYETLSEAVRLMGVVGGGGAAPRSRFTRPEYTPTPAPIARPAQPLPSPVAEPAPERAPEPVAAPTPPPAPAPEMRPRLRLTPEAADEEVFAPDAEPAPAAPALSWREILSHVDDETGPPPSGAGIMTEIRNLGIDPDALLPKPRLEDIAAVLQAGDANGAREVVRLLAPAAMRRLSRRILTDPQLRGRVEPFDANFIKQIAEAGASDPSGYAIARLLDSDDGRAFLLTDAALSDG